MQTFKPVWGDFQLDQSGRVINANGIETPKAAAVARRTQELVGKLPQSISDKK